MTEQEIYKLQTQLNDLQNTKAEKKEVDELKDNVTELTFKVYSIDKKLDRIDKLAEDMKFLEREINSVKATVAQNATDTKYMQRDISHVIKVTEEIKDLVNINWLGAIKNFVNNNIIAKILSWGFLAMGASSLVMWFIKTLQGFLVK